MAKRFEPRSSPALGFRPRQGLGANAALAVALSWVLSFTFTLSFALVGPSQAQVLSDDVKQRSDDVRWLSAPGSLRLDGQVWSARLNLDLGPSRVFGRDGALGTYSPWSLLGEDRDAHGTNRSRWQVLGDYYFPALGGLRATGGLLGTNTAMTYLGLGYGSERLGTRPMERGAVSWSWRADFGLTSWRDAGGPSVVTSGRFGDETWRDLRLRPVLQLGASYAF